MSSPPSASTPTLAALRGAARATFGIDRFRPGQLPLINAVLAGQNALGILPTGAGKSLSYTLPALFLPKATVVVSPLISLMQDQTDKLDEANVASAALSSALTAKDEREALQGIADGDRRIVYVTPERLESPEMLDLLATRGVSLLVVDEAHCISQWGHDFRPAYLAVRDAVARLGHPPVLALTATATPEVEADIQRQLGLASMRVVSTGIERENLFFEVLRTPSEDAKRTRLMDLLRTIEGTVIVYVATVKLANELFDWLAEGGLRVGRYHGKLPMREREEMQTRYMSGEVDVMVATNAFGLGIDKPDVRAVVHYQFPDSLETYYQEAGRAGRDGRPARAILLYRLEDRRVQAYFLGGKYPKRDELARTFEAVAAAPEKDGVAIADLARVADVSEKRAKVIVAQLDAMGIVRRRRGRAVRLRTFRDRAELDAYVTAYEARTRDDHERLETLMRYAQSTDCRMQLLRDYFGEPRGEPCAHCDNCRDEASRHVPVDEPAPVPSVPSLEADAAIEAPFAAGVHVRHRRFGRGEVVGVADERVTVAFERPHAKPETKVVAARYLRACG